MTGRRDDDRERPDFPLYWDEEKPSVAERIRRAFQRDEEDDDDPPSGLVLPGSHPAEAEEEDEAAAADPPPDGQPGRKASRAVPHDAGPVQRATIQLLPGRLTAEDPGVLNQEVRFLKTKGGGEVVTLGWDLAEPPHHVTLDHPSIRPRHARMTWREGSWWIESLVSGDEVHVNGSPLPCGAPAHRLKDGDRIRLGEVLLRFVHA